MIPSSNLAGPAACARGASNDGGFASEPAFTSRVMVPCGYSKMRSSASTLASALSTVKCALRGAPLRP